MKNIEALPDGGSEVTVRKLSPFDCVATACDNSNRVAMLVRRDGETLSALLKRLDKAIALPWVRRAIHRRGQRSIRD